MRLKKIAFSIFALVLIITFTTFLLVPRLDLNRYKSTIEKVLKDKTGREILIRSDIRLKVLPSVSLVVKDVTIQNAKWGLTPELAHVQRMEIEISLLHLLGGLIKIRRAILAGADIHIEVNKEGKLNFITDSKRKIEDEKSEEKASIPDFSVGNLEITDAHLDFRDSRTARYYRAKIDNLKISARDFFDQIKLDLDATIDDVPIHAQGTLGGFNTLSDSAKATSLDIRLQSPNMCLSFSGSVLDIFRAKGFNLKVNVQGNSVSKLYQLFRFQNDRPDVPFSATTKISDPSPKTLLLENLHLTCGNSDLEGIVKVLWGKKKPQIQASLSSNTLDLDELLSTADKNTPSRARQTQKIFSPHPLNLSFLELFDGRIGLNCECLKLRNLTFQNLKIDALQEYAKLTIHPLKGHFCGGDIVSNLKLRRKKSKLQALCNAKITGLNVQRFERAVGCNEIVQGNLNTEINVYGSGKSVAEIMGRLGGKIVMIMEKGKLNLRYVNLIGKDLASSTLRLLSPGKKTKTYTDINCFVTRLDIKNGKAYTTALVCDTGEMTVIGEGLINLKTERVDITLEPTPKKGVAGVSLSLNELVKPFRLGGTLAHPRLVLDSTRGAMVIGETLGGVILFGPVGIATALVNTTSDQPNICPLAIKAAKKGMKVSMKRKSKSEAAESIAKNASRSIKNTIHSIGNFFKRVVKR
ncbi:MAG TPA: AsmA family protein [Deltaproteobacteria bacterium]|nr:AsmA family protein [Deltaproteobacteria bacterium]